MQFTNDKHNYKHHLITVNKKFKLLLKIHMLTLFSPNLTGLFLILLKLNCSVLFTKIFLTCPSALWLHIYIKNAYIN